MKFPNKDFFSNCDQIRRNCGFGHIYWRNPSWKTLYLGKVYVNMFNPFLANVHILYPLKTQQNQRFFGVFRVFKMGRLAKNGLKPKSIYKYVFGKNS